MMFCMPSGLKRYQQQGCEHAINFSCFHRRQYLADQQACIAFEEVLEALRGRHQFSIFGYVLMPNHVHLLLSEPNVYTLATTISVLKAETSKRLKGNRVHFWQTRYFDFNVLTHKKHVEKLRYIHRNPVASGLVEKPEDWPWSSFRHYATGETGRVLIDSQTSAGSFPPAMTMKPS
jgi:putative transposase